MVSSRFIEGEKIESSFALGSPPISPLKGANKSVAMGMCPRKLKVRPLLFFTFLSLIFFGCAHPGKEKQTTRAKATLPAIKSEYDKVNRSEASMPILVYHCQPENDKPLTRAEATLLATLLANGKAMSIYHCQPFHYGQPATFLAGRWFWRQIVSGDFEATVHLAANGATNSVTVNLLDNSVF